jgi:hypothetical protein
MHTSLVLIALMGPGAAPAVAGPEAPSWQDSYRAARAAGRERGKPLAIFIGSGPAGWDKLTGEGGLTAKARQRLADDYVCVYIDRAKPAGQSLAEAFEVGTGAGLVLSTKDQSGQSFWHAGTMSQAELEGALQKFASVTTVTQTEQLSRTRVSYYPNAGSNASPVTQATAYQPVMSYAPQAIYAPTYAAPASYAPSYGGFGGYSGGFGGGYSGGGYSGGGYSGGGGGC